MSAITFEQMLQDTSTYRRIRCRAVIEKLTPAEAYVRLRQLGYDLFGIRDSMENCEITET